MGRVYNFSAGPAVLPEEVLREAAAEMLDYQGTGMSVMEMSHRSAAFKGIIETAEADLRDLMNIPDNYKVLFLQGGATQQFAARRPTRKRSSSAMPAALPRAKTGTSPTSPTSTSLSSVKMPTTSTSAKTRPSTARITTSFLKRAASRW